MINPTRLRSWIRRYGNAGMLLCACVLGWHYVWTKRRPGLLLAIALCLPSGLFLHGRLHRAPSQHPPTHHPLSTRSALIPTTPVNASRSIASLAADLRAGLRRYPNSYQLFLRNSYHVIDAALDRKEWAQVEPSLTAQGFQKEYQGSEEADSRRCRLTLPGLVYRPPSGPQHLLTIDISICPNVSRTTPTRMILYLREISLSAQFNRPLTDIVNQSPYPKGSVLDAFLGLPKIRKEFPNYTLTTLELTYRPPTFSLGLEVSEGVSAPYSYGIRMDCVRRKNDHEYSKSVFYSAASVLDPVKRLKEKQLPSRPFLPEDTFGPFYGDVGSEGIGGLAVGGVIELVGRKDTETPELVNQRTAYSIADLRALPADITALKLAGWSSPSLIDR